MLPLFGLPTKVQVRHMPVKLQVLSPSWDDMRPRFELAEANPFIVANNNGPHLHKQQPCAVWLVADVRNRQFHSITAVPHGTGSAPGTHSASAEPG
jgi:hypothetical protein